MPVRIGRKRYTNVVNLFYFEPFDNEPITFEEKGQGSEGRGDRRKKNPNNKQTGNEGGNERTVLCAVK